MIFLLIAYQVNVIGNIVLGLVIRTLCRPETSLNKELVSTTRSCTQYLENSKIIAKEGNRVERKNKETLEIKLHGNDINRDDGETLGEVWNPIIRRLQNSCR